MTIHWQASLDGLWLQLARGSALSSPALRWLPAAGSPPRSATPKTETALGSTEEIAGPAPKRATQLSKRLQRCVLAAALQPIEGRAADAQAPSHLALGQPGPPPETAE